MNLTEILEKLRKERTLLDFSSRELARWQGEFPPERFELDIGADHFTIVEPAQAIAILSALIRASHKNISMLKATLEAELTALLKELKQEEGVR